MANILTVLRIICGLLILVFPAFSGWFYFLYILGGVTDAVDGTVARKLGQESDFGARLDTIADFVFALSVAIKIVDSQFVPLWAIIWMGIIVVIKIGGPIAGYIKYHELRTVHSKLNKACGIVVYLVLLIRAQWIGTLGLIVVCTFATIAAIVEFIEIFFARKADS